MITMLGVANPGVWAQASERVQLRPLLKTSRASGSMG